MRLEHYSEEKLKNFKKTIKNLAWILNCDKTTDILYASLKRFDLCFETSYQLINNISKLHKLKCNSYEKFLRNICDLKIVKNFTDWKNLIRDRKKSYSITNDEEAQKIYVKLPEYLKLFKELLANAEK